MTERAEPVVPLPLDTYAQQFDSLFATRIQRQRVREYLAGLLLPRDRNKTLTALVGAEPITQAQSAPVQRLQFLLCQSDWDAEAVNDRRIALRQADQPTRAHADGVLVIDETGDRKDGTKTAHVAHQYLGSIGKLANGIVAVTSLWADERVYYPLHVRPYTPAVRLAGGRQNPAFRTKPQLARELITAARQIGIPFRAVVADSLYGENAELEAALWSAQVPYVLALKPSHGVWAPEEEAHSPHEAAARLEWQDADQPGDWTAVVRTFRDGHHETWWAADLRLRGYGPDQPTRVVVATTDPARLPVRSTWYLVTNLPLSAAGLDEVVRLYGLRQWVEQSYKQVKQELGWADFEVRSDRAIRRHWYLVCCAFTFCWWAEWRTAEGRPAEGPVPAGSAVVSRRAGVSGAGEKSGGSRPAPDGSGTATRSRSTYLPIVAAGAAPRAQLVDALARAAALLEGMVLSGPTSATADLAECRH